METIKQEIEKLNEEIAILEPILASEQAQVSKQEKILQDAAERKNKVEQEKNDYVNLRNYWVDVLDKLSDLETEDTKKEEEMEEGVE